MRGMLRRRYRLRRSEGMVSVPSSPSLLIHCLEVSAVVGWQSFGIYWACPDIRAYCFDHQRAGDQREQSIYEGS